MIDYCEAKKNRPWFEYSTLINILFASFFTLKAIDNKNLLQIIVITLYWLLLIFIVFGRTKLAYELAKKVFPNDKILQIVPYDFSGVIIDHESKKIYFGERGFLSIPLAIDYNQITRCTYTSHREDCIEIMIGREKKYLYINNYKDTAQEVLRRFFVNNKEFSLTKGKGSIN